MSANKRRRAAVAKAGVVSIPIALLIWFVDWKGVVDMKLTANASEVKAVKEIGELNNKDVKEQLVYIRQKVDEMNTFLRDRDHK